MQPILVGRLVSKISKKHSGNSKAAQVSEIDYKIILQNEFATHPYFIKLQTPIFKDGNLLSFDKFCLFFSKMFSRKNWEVLVSDKSVQQNQQTRISLSIIDFLAFTGDQTLYIAQIPIFEAYESSDFFDFDKPNSQNSTKIKKINLENWKILRNKMSIPDFLLSKVAYLKFINVWVNKTPAISEWHFDLFENYITVIRGQKTVSLLNRSLLPENTKNEQIEEIVAANSGLLSQVQTFVLKANSMLKIPEGWLHRVVSLENTFAVNFWFKNTLQRNPIIGPSLISQFLNYKLEMDWVEEFKTTFDNPGFSKSKIRDEFIEMDKFPFCRNRYSELRKIIDLIDVKISIQQINQPSFFFLDQKKDIFYEKLNQFENTELFQKLEQNFREENEKQKLKIIKQYFDI